jgi:hypothetical protein
MSYVKYREMLENEAASNGRKKDAL